MNFQMQLEGVTSVDHIISDHCCDACYHATGKRCSCRCGGKFHGIGSGINTKTIDETPVDDETDQTEYDFDIAEQQMVNAGHPDNYPPTLMWWRFQVKEDNCRWCGASLKGQPIQHYDHSGGWDVLGYQEKQWLYIVCHKCDYQWALWKLGVSRNQ